MDGPRAVFHATPQAVGDARLGAPGSSRPLVGRVATDRHGRQPCHPGTGVEARRAGEPAVDDDADTLDRQRRLGDVRRQHDAAAAGRRRGQRHVLLLQRQRAGQGAHVDVRADDGAQLIGGAHDLADPRQEHEDIAGVAAQGQHDRCRGGPLEAVSALAGQPTHFDRMRAALAGDDGRGTVDADQRGKPGRVGCGRHRHDAQVGPQRCRLERERQAEIGRQVAFVDLVEDDDRHAGEFWIVLQATREHALREHLDARGRTDPPLVAGLVADQPTDAIPGEVGHPPGHGTRR